MPHKNIDVYIAESIRNQVNGSNSRDILSYSKSLGTCLFKYNDYCDNELHIYCNPSMTCNTLIYNYEYKSTICEDYSLENALNKIEILKRNEQIRLHNFIIDTSNNYILDKYLLKFTEKHLKKFASPQKDNEIIMMQADSDYIIKEYLNSIYILYALQLKYRFLNYDYIAGNMKQEILELDDRYFPNCEYDIFKKICNDINKNGHISYSYDAISQALDIFSNQNIKDSYYESDSYSSSNQVTYIIWKYFICYYNTYISIK
ncbi:hypothetical protein [Intestinibacter bartlettii]|mgnify:CR=1 FL=1|uniref:Uncharacterized protein n=1 Tax=Intestinibacter bartlettii CAG:1329 TaxID=1263063 RepID=R5X617_9FIRM|nr:hypothetical protein [Intestinibacter bartlettii]CDA10230.1 unknown [Intestinibacter bartlettii CAG:1329]